jgi:MarR family transcriptional regulator, organic hydroperoxide resistance regulator
MTLGMGATTKPQTGAARDAWQLVFELFGRYKPRMFAIQAEYDLKPPMVFALQEREEPKPMGRLANVLHCDSSNITWITDRLEERGLVERLQDPRDRRVKLLALTEEGQRLRTELLARLHEPPDELRSLSVADQRALRDILRRALAAGE